jgi:PAS domain S-box-containing protein
MTPGGANPARPEADELFRTIEETTTECVKIVAADGALLHMNSAGLAMLGARSADAVIGRSIYNLIAPEDRERYREFHARICAGAKGSLEFDIVGLNGTRRQMESHAAPLLYYDGSTVQLAITRDTTSRKQAERATLLLGAIVDSSDDAIISKDLNGVITSWNQGAQRLFGYTAAEAVGHPITILIPHDRLDEEPNILARLRRGERVDHFETVRQRKDGTLRDISLTISPVRDAGGRIVGASKIARDITDRKRSEQAIAKLLEEQKRITADLQRANRDLEQFAYSASHDLQEPLRSVQLYSELLAKRWAERLDGEALECLEHLRNGAARMEALVHDLLAYTQVMRFDPSAEARDAGEALTVALANLADAIAKSGAQITSDPLPSPRVQGAHLQQLFQNLIGNSIKYRSPGRPPVVHVSAERQDRFWMFSVSDNGIGIAPEHREKIFGLFKRLHSSEEYSGTGLGLVICQRVVERYDGRIWVESEPGQGSTFRFTLPA